jgi:acetyltransferase
VDAAIAAFVPPLGTLTRDVATAIVRVNEEHPEKPLLAVLMGRQGLPAGLAQLHDASIPAYIFPESAARALGDMWRYRQIAARREGKTVSFKTDDKAVEAIIDATLQAGHEKLSEPDAMRVLEAYGIPVVPWRFVSKDGPRSLAAAAAEAAGDVGLPVALKIVSPDITHKTDVGGVALGLESRAEVERAVREMLKRVTTPSKVPAKRSKKSTKRATPRKKVEPRIDGVLIQQMADPGIETIVGLTRMPRVGALVMFGMGGIFVEALRDVVMRLSPLYDTDAEEMIREVKMFQLLEGIRGQAPRDLAAQAEAILRISQLAERHPRITEMDVNPLIALEKGAVAIDARLQVSAEPEG